jgi:hypothetical protein
MAEKFCGECGSALKNGKCPKCTKPVKKQANVVKEEPKKSGSSFGWGVLGFFFPIVGLILFLALKNKNKGASKASGIGALIGVGLEILATIITFLMIPVFVRKTVDNMTEVNVVVKKVGSAPYRSLGDYYYLLDYNEATDDCKDYSCFNDTKLRIVALSDVDSSSKNNELFSIERRIKEGTYGSTEYFLVFNRGTRAQEEFEINDPMLYETKKFNFYLKDDKMLFSAKDGIYVFDLKTNKALNLSNSWSGDDFKGYVLKDVSIESDKIVAKMLADSSAMASEPTQKFRIVYKVEAGLYTSVEGLTADLAAYNIEDFIYSYEYTYEKDGKSFIEKQVKKTTVTEHVKEIISGGNIVSEIDVNSIDMSKKFETAKYVLNDLKLAETNKNYEWETYSFSVANGLLILKGSSDGRTYATVSNVDRAYYFSQDDCIKQLEYLIVYSGSKVYYIDATNHVAADTKAVELKNSYTNFYVSPVQSYTCGGGYIAIGKTADGNYYDLNGEKLFKKDVYNVYNSPDLYVNADRTYKLYTKESKAKAVFTDISQNVRYVLDADGYVYEAAYDVIDGTEATLFKNSKLSKIGIDKNNDIILTFADGSTQKLDYFDVTY